MFSVPSQPVMGPKKPPVQSVQGVKRSGREADHSPASSAEVQNDVVIPPILHIVLMAWC
jgi:hypothetical protein